MTVTSSGMPGAMSAARPQLIRALNERLLLGHIRDRGPCSRADLAPGMPDDVTVTATSAIGSALTTTTGVPGWPIACHGCSSTYRNIGVATTAQASADGPAAAHRVPPVRRDRRTPGPRSAGR